MSSMLPSGILPSDATSLAPVPATAIPADVQKAGPKAEQLYSTALDFEQLLLQQLTSELQSTTQIDGGDGSDDGSDDSSDDGSSDGSDGTTSLMTQMLPDAFAQGLTSAGGIGIARELYNAFAQQAGISTDPATPSSPSTTAAGSSPSGRDASNGGLP